MQSIDRSIHGRCLGVFFFPLPMSRCCVTLLLFMGAAEEEGFALSQDAKPSIFVLLIHTYAGSW